MTISKAFTAYSILVLVTKPLSDIIIALPVIASVFTSFQRIQDFLNGEERNDTRLIEPEKYRKNVAAETFGLNLDSVLGSSNEDFELAERRSSAAKACEHQRTFIASVSGRFSWSGASEPVIDIQEWEIRRGTITFVLGPVGCGKSTLLKALLGELSAFEGTILANYSSVSYCSQTPWLPNETIRKVIIGSSDLDELWYQKVIYACALDIDINNWPSGEKMVVGTKGVSISGGQKQRLVTIASSLQAIFVCA